MKRLLIAVAALPLLVFTGIGCAHSAPPPYYAPPPPGAIASQGYNDGVNAARRDMAQGRPPRVDRHPRFRNPPVPPGGPAHIYRDNFHRGYDWAYRGGR
jgi:hypothetical protein